MKYDNVLVKIIPIQGEEDWEIETKIIDFGISRDNAAAGKDAILTETANPKPRGGRAFLSPEILRFVLSNEPIDPKYYNTGMDIYRGVWVNMYTVQHTNTFFHFFENRRSFDFLQFALHTPFLR